MNLDKQKLMKMFLLLFGILVIVWGLSHLFKSNSKSLSDYAAENPELQKPQQEEQSSQSEDAVVEDTKENLQNSSEESGTFLPIGASLNRDSQLMHRISYTKAFYYEPLSDNLKRFITGVSFPEALENSENLDISYEELRYVHILHYNFEGNLAEGELICNEAIAQDLVEIFYELYRNEYQIEKVCLIDEYDGDDRLSMEDNNTFCFSYRSTTKDTTPSKHALGRAIDINPLYNPMITYHEDGSEVILPAAGAAYADRSKSFPYKIDENDLCYKLFTERGFVWGGNWNAGKAYHHFQKVE